MKMAYLNYPNSTITIHLDPHCNVFLKHDKPKPRIVKLNPITISGELQKFKKNHYSFKAGNDGYYNPFERTTIKVNGCKK